MSSHQERSRYFPFVWATILLSIALFCSALVYLMAPPPRAIEREQLNQRVEQLARDIERLQRELKRLEREVPELLEEAGRAADENRIVPVYWETAPDGSQRRGSLFPDEQMYRDFDVPAR